MVNLLKSPIGAQHIKKFLHTVRSIKINCRKKIVYKNDRIREEYLFCRQNPRDHVGVGLVGNNLTQWRANIVGPVGSPYENGLFILSIKFPETYPTVPPEIKFETPIYHPNISKTDSVC